MRSPRRALVAALVAFVVTNPAGSTDARQASAASSVPHFIEESARAGLEHVYDGAWEYFVGGGVAAFDCDDDGRPEIYLAGGSAPAALYRNASTIGGALAFSPIASPVTDLTGVTGAYPIDIDSDGTTDLAVLRRGENALLRGLGDCRFERANEAWSFDGDDDWTVAFSAKWDPGETLPTLAVGDYLTIVKLGEKPECDASAVYRPDAGGAGYGAPETLSPGYCTLSLLFSDWGRSGRRDLRMTNDRHYYLDGEDQLWRVDPGTAPVAYTRAEGWRQLRVEGMGIASDDLDGDGYPEVYVTSMADNKLQTLADGPDQPSYRDIAFARRVHAAQPSIGGEHLPSTAWHAEFDDVNNDGRLDLFVSKGNVDTMPDHAAKDPNELFVARRDGTFKASAKAAGIVDFGRTRGAALVDLNLDGMLDLVTVNRQEPVRVWRNVGLGDARKPKPMGGWVSIELRQPAPNTDAIGAWIEVAAGGRTAIREVTIGGGHAGGQLGPVHFGLGASQRARIRVHWPDGAVSDWMPVDANERIRVDRTSAVPTVLVGPG